MKGTVFIGWSSDTILAKKVRAELKVHGYNSIIGGDEELVGNLSIADTIAKQIDGCCQSVFIIKKNSKGLISNNITFEIGYSVSKYNLSMQKLHLFYLDIDPNDDSIPSDLLGLWAHHMSTEGKTEDDIVREIAKSFLRHQKAEITDNKMAVVTDWLGLYTLLSSHLEVPKYSDFEIAQYIFLLVESASAAHTWTESLDLVRRYGEIVEETSTELYLAIRLFEVVEETYCRRSFCNRHIFLAKTDFRMLRGKIQSLIDAVSCCTESDTNIDSVFAKWFLMAAKQKMQFLYMLNSNDPDTADKTPVLDRAEALNREVLAMCDELRTMNSTKNKEFIWEIQFMSHRNLAVIAQYRGDREAERTERFESLRYTREIRGKYYGKIDARAWETFEREYYTALMECLEFMDGFDREDGREELKDYVNRLLELRDSNTVYIDRIRNYLDDKPVSGL